MPIENPLQYIWAEDRNVMEDRIRALEAEVARLTQVNITLTESEQLAAQEVERMRECMQVALNELLRLGATDNDVLLGGNEVVKRIRKLLKGGE